MCGQPFRDAPAVVVAVVGMTQAPILTGQQILEAARQDIHKLLRGNVSTHITMDSPCMTLSFSGGISMGPSGIHTDMYEVPRLPAQCSVKEKKGLIFKNSHGYISTSYSADGTPRLTDRPIAMHVLHCIPIMAVVSVEYVTWVHTGRACT